MQLINGKYPKAISVRLTIGIFLLLILAPQVLLVPSNSQLTAALNNAAHTPWFMCTTLILWLMLKRVLGLSFWQLFMICGAMALTLGITLEAVQVLTSRQASWGDVGLNLLGALSGLSLILMVHFWRHSRSAALFLLTLAAVSLFIGPTGNLGSLLWLQHERDSMAPLLVEFSDPSNITLRNFSADWSVETNFSAWSDFEQRNTARVTFDQRSRWPGIRIAEPYPYWESYNSLEIYAYLDTEIELPLSVRLETFQSRGMDSTVDILLVPGANRIEIPILQLLLDQASRAEKVKTLYIFGDRDVSGRSFILGSIRLKE